jgi:hypothetical protein
MAAYKQLLGAKFDKNDRPTWNAEYLEIQITTDALSRLGAWLVKVAEFDGPKMFEDVDKRFSWKLEG